MSATDIPAALRRLVIARADYLREYCLLHEDDTLFSGEVDHVISEKHGGRTHEDNLAYTCLACNRSKGSDLGSLTQHTRTLVRFYSPRQDQWHQHFHLDGPNGMLIVPLTEIGEVTARIFGFNDPDRLLERRALQSQIDTRHYQHKSVSTRPPERRTLTLFPTTFLQVMVEWRYGFEANNCNRRAGADPAGRGGRGGDRPSGDPRTWALA